MSLADELIAAALDAVEPRRLVARALRLERRAHVLAIGKAAPGMFLGATEALGARIESSLVVAKHESPDVRVVRGDHPVPGAASVAAARRVMEFVDEIPTGDRLIVLLSGGASALVAAPLPGLTVDDIATATDALLRGGASIAELNTVRRAMDALKGGGLAARCRGDVSTYVISDVLGDPLEVIGSGPTARNPTTTEDAVAVLDRFGVELSLPSAEPRTTPDVPHVVLANCATALDAALQRAGSLGLHAHVLTSRLQGEAREAGKRFAEHLAGYDGPLPACFMAGGETTVSVTGCGSGGPSLELALAAVEPLAGRSATVVTFATDGEDGPTDAAGARVNGTTRDRGEALGLHAAQHLTDNDAYTYFAALGDLIMTGPTGTNVNDLVFGLVGID